MSIRALINMSAFIALNISFDFEFLLYDQIGNGNDWYIRKQIHLEMLKKFLKWVKIANSF